MDINFDQFRKFAKERLSQAAFNTETDSDKSSQFHTSLISAIQLMQWTLGCSNQSGDDFKLVAGFVDKYTPNALADRYQGTHYIGMHSALFVAITEFAMFCFTQRDFFPDVGDPSQETSPVPWNDRVPGIWLIDHTKQGGRVDDEHSQRLTPRDNERYVMSLYLAFLMSRFVWLHELSHCFNGHVGYVHQHNLALRLYELPEELPAVQVTRKRQKLAVSDELKCLEFDADQSAFWGNCNIQIHSLENIEGIRALDENLRLRLTLFGAYAMTWLFEKFQEYLDTKDGHTHPAPMLRLHNLLHTASANVLSLHDDMPAIHDVVLKQFDTIGGRIPGMYGTTNLSDIMKDGGISDELVRFFDRRNEQKIALQDFEFKQNKS